MIGAGARKGGFGGARVPPTYINKCVFYILYKTMATHPSSSANDIAHYLSSWNPKVSDNIWKNLIDLIALAQKNNPYEAESLSSQMWDEQNGINFPMMYVASVYLYLYAQSRGCDTFLFATRDCCHWYKIFTKLFPETNSHYFHCSRNMLTRAAEEHNVQYKQYVQTLIKTNVDKTIYVDIHGTCQRVLTYFEKEFGQMPYCFLLSSSYRAYPQFPSICRKAHDVDKLLNIVFDARGTPIEMLNFDVIGTIQDYNGKGPVRDPPEYSTKHLEAYHVCIRYLVNHMKSWNNAVTESIKNKDITIDFDELSHLVRRIYRVIQDNKPVLNEFIKHPGKH